MTTAEAPHLSPSESVLQSVYASAKRLRTSDDVVALLGFRPNEIDFPPYFVSALELKLAAAFAIPLTDDSNKAQAFDQMFQRQFAQARSIESQGRTPAKITLGGLRAYHGGRP